ncbi:site-specific integrase [uncultured Megamonas sp.]|uniref:tyrosine-type recombinase/integrase n=1 Tax=uncultured Megamonas sp. TaxID=286140 RepID=UPI00259B2390|nr:site-specific integrase [uncultured Megamonas sp.]
MAKRENGEGSIYYEKDRNKFCAAIVDPNGKRIRKRFNTREEAKDWIITIQSNIVNNNYIAPTNITLGEWIIEWLCIFKKNLRDKSKLQYMQTSVKLKPIAAIPLQKMTPVIAQKFLNDLPKEMASSSKKKVYQLLFTVAKKAYKLGMINKNFMEVVEPPIVQQKEIEIFTQNELQKIFKYLNENNIPYNLAKQYPFILLAATTGARLGELLALKWENVNFKENKIQITSTLNYIPKKGLIENPPKTSAGKRYITIPPKVTMLLKKLKPDNEKIIYLNTSRSYVFHTKNGTPYHPRNISKYWKQILINANVPYKNFHVLRHTHATQLLANNIPILEVAKRLGHSKASHTLNLYGHAIPNMDKEVADKVAKIYTI